MKLMGQELVERGLITKQQLEIALREQKRSGERLGEVLVYMNMISEVELLKFLASRLHTRYISSEKLSKVKITPTILKMVPLSFAEQFNVLPILYEPDRMILSVLMAEPQNEALKEELRLRTKCQEVIAYLALKPTIRAGIQKFYRGQADAFEQLSYTTVNVGGEGMSNSTVRRLKQAGGTAYNTNVTAPGSRLADELTSVSLFSDNVYIETLNILVGLLELKPDNFRGHSASVARFTKMIAEKMNLPVREMYLLIIAAYLHDVGKKSVPHMTLISLKTEEDITRAKKYYLAPVRLFESVGLPPSVPNILSHLFERYDGRGFPEGLKEDEIPLGSRIITIVDSYEELARNPAHGFSKPTEAMNYLRQYKGIYFDPQIFNLFEDILDSMRKKPKDDMSDAVVLIVDNNQNDVQFLQQRLKDANIKSIAVSTTTEALEKLKKEKKISIIISEVNVTPLNGFEFCEQIRGMEDFANMPFIFLSRNDSSDFINRGFEAGADDFVAKPYRSEMLIAKLRRFVAKAKAAKAKGVKREIQGGLAGNLKEIPIADLVQLFSTGRKTGVLTLNRGEETGQIFFENGDVINAFYKDLEGEDAFYQLIRWEDGTFQLTSEITMPERKIEAPTAHLIMEGMRIWDEERAGKNPRPS